MKKPDNLSEQEILDILKKVNKLKQDQLKLEAEYYQDKFLNALPAKKVLKFRIAKAAKDACAPAKR